MRQCCIGSLCSKRNEVIGQLNLPFELPHFFYRKKKTKFYRGLLPRHRTIQMVLKFSIEKKRIFDTFFVCFYLSFIFFSPEGEFRSDD